MVTGQATRWSIAGALTTILACGMAADARALLVTAQPNGTLSIVNETSEGGDQTGNSDVFIDHRIEAGAPDPAKIIISGGTPAGDESPIAEGLHLAATSASWCEPPTSGEVVCDSAAVDHIEISLGDGGDFVLAQELSKVGTHTFADPAENPALIVDLGDGADRFVGGPFAETVRDGLGTDELYGYAPAGGGNDLFIQPDSADPAVDDAGDFLDTAYEQGVVDYSARSHDVGVDVTLHTGEANDGAPEENDTVNAHGVRGTAYDDKLSGGSDGFFSESIWGGAGNDLVAGHAGSDRLFGEAGADTLLAADGDPDAVMCGTGPDTAVADPPAIDADVEPAVPPDEGCEGVTRVVPDPVETFIDARPPTLTNDSSPTVEFSSNYAWASFQCSLNGSTFNPCASPLTATLPDGSYTLFVRAHSGMREDQSPAEVRTTIDTVRPETSLTPVPGGFDLASDEDGVAFECAIEGGSFVACADPLDMSALPPGSYALAVRAVDAAGNQDASPATTTFTVASAPTPVTTSNVTPAVPEQPSPPAAMASKLRLPAGAKLAAGGSGPIRLTFTCAVSAASCDAAVLELVVRVGRKTVRVPVRVPALAPGTSTAVSVKLPNKVRKAIARAGKRGLKAKLDGPAGSSTTVTLTKKRR